MRHTSQPCYSISNLSSVGKTIKNYKDVDCPRLLHLPFLDETYSVPKHLFFRESGRSTTHTSDIVNLKHISHQHPLILVDQTQYNDKSSKINAWLLKCHNPMKNTQLLCNGCLRPIVSTMPFYRCANDDQGCDFALHEQCI